MSDYRHFNAEPHGRVMVVRLIDPKLSDTLSVTELQDELLELIDEMELKNAVVDFNEVDYCSTAVINGLLRAKRLIAGDGELKLCRMNDTIREAYRMLNLDGTVFIIYATLDEAIQSF